MRIGEGPRAGPSAWLLARLSVPAAARLGKPAGRIAPKTWSRSRVAGRRCGEPAGSVPPRGEPTAAAPRLASAPTASVPALIVVSRIRVRA